MKQNNLFKDFTKKYQLSKTLRFELIPIGETENHIKEKGLIKKAFKSVYLKGDL